MNDKQLLHEVANTVTQKPKVELVIDVKHPTLWEKLRKRHQRTFVIKPTTVASMYMLSGRTVLWQEELFASLQGDQTNLSAIITLIQANLADVVYCTAVIIQNDGKEPSKALLNWLERNTDALDLAEMIVPVLGATHMQAFLNSIILLKGTSDVVRPKREMSLNEQGEMIAPGVS